MRLRAETAMTVKWIADRLQMGSPGYVNHLLYRHRKEKVKRQYDNIKTRLLQGDALQGIAGMIGWRCHSHGFKRSSVSRVFAAELLTTRSSSA